MSMDPSLKTSNSLSRHRNVLSRAERLGRLKDLDRRSETDTVFGLPKVANRSVKVTKKEKKAEGTEGAAAPAAVAAPEKKAPDKKAPEKKGDKKK